MLHFVFEFTGAKSFKNDSPLDDLVISPFGAHLGSLQCLDVLTPPEVPNYLLVPLEQDEEFFGKRLISNSEYPILKEEGRLLPILHLTFTHYRDTNPYLVNNFLRAYAEEHGGLEGPKREQILFLGGLLLQQQRGLQYFRDEFGQELRAALLEEGLLVDCMQLGLLRSLEQNFALKDAFREAIKDEGKLPQTTQDKIRARRVEWVKLLYEQIQESPSKEYFDHQEQLLRALERTGESPNGELKPYFTGVVERIIDMGRLDRLIDSKIGREVMDIIHAEGRLIPLLDDYIVRMKQRNKGPKNWARYEKAITEYIQSRANIKERALN